MEGDINKRREEWKEMAIEVLHDKIAMYTDELMNTVAGRLDLRGAGAKYYALGQQKLLLTDVYKTYFLVSNCQKTSKQIVRLKTGAAPSAPTNVRSKKDNLLDLELNLIKLLETEKGSIELSTLWTKYTKYFHSCPVKSDFSVLNLNDVVKGMDKVCVVKEGHKDVVKLKIPSAYDNLASRSRSSSSQRDLGWGTGAATFDDFPVFSGDIRRKQRNRHHTDSEQSRGSSCQSSRSSSPAINQSQSALPDRNRNNSAPQAPVRMKQGIGRGIQFLLPTPGSQTRMYQNSTFPLPTAPIPMKNPGHATEPIVIDSSPETVQKPSTSQKNDRQSPFFYLPQQQQLTLQQQQQQLTVQQQHQQLLQQQQLPQQQQQKLQQPTARLRQQPVVLSSESDSDSDSDVVDVTAPSVKKLERKSICVDRINVRGNLSKAQIEAIAQDCIDLIADANEYVSVEKINQLLLQRLGIPSVNNLGHGIRKIEHLNPVYQHLRMLAKVNAYIQAFVKTRSMYTLYELGQDMIEFDQDKKSFESLHLGPLQCLPVVYENFRFPQDVAEIPEITSLDLLEYIREYMTKNNKWSERLELPEVMNYIVDERKAPDAYHLGVGIKSLPLAAQVLKKAQRDASRSKKEFYDSFKDKLKTDIGESFRKFRAVMLTPVARGENEIRTHYLKLPPEVVLREIFEKFVTLINVVEPQTKAEQRKQRKFVEGVHKFFGVLEEDDLAQSLFHLCVCISDTLLEESALELLNPATHEENDGEQEIGDSSKTPEKPAIDRPSRRKVLQLLKEYIERCLAHGSVTLSNLCRIEDKLTSEFNAEEFSEMGFGRFLTFITSDSDAKELLSECGGNISGSTTTDNDNVFKPSHFDVLVFIKQCFNAGITQPEVLESAVCNQFGIKDIKQLGYGNINTLKTAASKQGRHFSSDYNIIYESSLVSTIRSPTSGSKEVGALGLQTKDTALCLLHNCPLLTDLYTWSHWTLVFEPQLGPLKDFIQKYGGQIIKVEGESSILTTDILALETKPGVLMKLSTHSTIEKFIQSLGQNNPVIAMGHLLSLIVLSKGVENTSLALLANHIKVALLKLHSQSGQSDSSGQIDQAAKFILECLCLLPQQICVSIGNQLFLVPLSDVVGSTKSKILIIEACQTSDHRTQLEELGCLFGIDEWTENLLNKSKPKKADIQKIGSEFIDDFDEPDEDQAIVIDSDESDSFLSEDDDYIKDVKQKENKEEKITEEEGESSDVIILEDEVIQNETDENKEEIKPAVSETTENKADNDQPDIEIIVDTEEVVDIHKKLIQDIRKDVFGVGIELNEDGERLVKILQERQGRSLDRLSKDLYSKDTHFVLELIQNADDNTYSTDVVKSSHGPSVMFRIDDNGITLFNNEQGFKEVEIKAICDVGRSTKGKHKYGYIGQKGIGFKSVFRITDRPEIHSNGYHFCFDVKSGPMGYIMPHWVDTEDEDSMRWTTKIVLPIKEEMKSQTRPLAARFNDIHPSLLLFLHRLKEITIDNKIEDSVLKILRHDKSDNIVEIKHGNKTDRWLVIKKILDSSKISLQVKSGVDVESTEIALAFPLASKKHKRQYQILPDKQLVFAFLPLRNYGFRFIVQGDFDVPSSRECVDRDSAWNQWLRNEIHILFIEALDIFKAHPDFEELEALLSFLQFVPMEDEVLDFFKPVASQILGKLRAKECLPVVSSKPGVYEWKMPSQTVIVNDALVREVISPDILLTHLNLYYLSQDVANMLNPTLARNLGVEIITTERLLQIGRFFVQMFAIKQIEKTQQVITLAKWMACVYRSLDELNPDESVYKELKAMRVIPLSTGDITSLSDETVFIIPPQNKTQKTKTTGDPVNRIERDLKTVDSGLISTPDNEINSQVQKLLLHIGIKQLSPNDLIHHHIIPTLQSDHWKSKSREVLISYVMYIKNQYDKQPSIINMEEFKTVVQLASNHGFQSPVDNSIHFTPSYGSSINLSDQLPGYDWILIDGEYLTSTGTSSQHQWHDFLQKLGVTDFIHVKSEDIPISYENMDKTLWADYKELLPKYENGYIVSDFICEEFKSLVLHNKHPSTFHQQMKMLFTKIDQEWNQKYSRYMTASLKSSDSHELKTVQSSFAYYLKTLEWTPSLEFTKHERGKGFEVVTKETNKIACDLYVPDPRIQNILAHTVSYINTSVYEQSSFCDFLQVKKTLDAQMVKSLLIEWSQRTKPNQPASYIGSLNQMKSIYVYLCDNLINKDAQNLFFDNAVIFVPKSKLDRNQDETTLVDGLMLNREEVWWQDSSDLFNYYNYLLKEYHSELADKHIISGFYRSLEFENLFINFCNISKSPKMMDFAELLKLLVTVHEPTNKNAFYNVLQIYSIIGLTLTPHKTDDAMIDGAKQEERLAIVQKLSKLKIFCSKKDVWVSLDDKPMIADNPELEKMFIDKENVHFIKITLSNKQKDKRTKIHEHHTKADEDVRKFIKMFPIPKLSESMRTESVPGILKPCPSLNLYMHNITPIIQRYLYTHFPDVYNAFVSKNMAETLLQLKFFQAGKLEVVYSLKNVLGVVISKTEKCVFKESEFVFDKDHIENYSIINKEIANYFSQDNNELKKFLSLLLIELTQAMKDQSEQAIVEIIEKEEIDELPSTEVVWFVPPPIIQPRIPTPPPPPAVPEMNAEGGNGSSKEKTLRSWPPQAPDDSKKRDTNVTYKPLGATLWPPPKPEGHVPKERPNFLPSNIKVVDAQSAERDSSKDGTDEMMTERPTVQRVPSTGSHGSQEHRQNPSGSSQERPVSQEEAVNNTTSSTPATSSLEDTGGDSRKRKMEDSGSIIGNESKRRASSPPLPTGSNTNTNNSTPYNRQHRSPSQNKSTDPNHKRPFNLDAPTWQDSFTVIPYDDLPSSSEIPLPSDFPEESDSDLSEVGKWGEHLVYDYLLKQKNEDPRIESVEWVNEEQESGNPYDFIITYHNENKELIKLYSEVKSTRSSSKRMFEISMQEVKFAMDDQVNYEIYRLFNAGQSDNVKLVRINNISNKENIRLCMYI